MAGDGTDGRWRTSRWLLNHDHGRGLLRRLKVLMAWMAGTSLTLLIAVMLLIFVVVAVRWRVGRHRNRKLSTNEIEELGFSRENTQKRCISTRELIYNIELGLPM